MFQATRVRVLCTFALLALSSVVISLVGCDLTSLSPSLSPSCGTVKLNVTDRPFPFDLISSAAVTITKVEVHKAPASQPAEQESADGEADDHNQQPNPATDEMQEEVYHLDASAYAQHRQSDQGEGSGQQGHGTPSTQPDSNGDGPNAPSTQPDNGDNADWVVIYQGQKEFNLLDLRNGRTNLLADTTIPAGTYDQMRLIVTQGTVTLKDGRMFRLKIPSGASTGIKMHFTFTVGDGQEKQLLLDVNLSRAFKAIPEKALKHPEDIKGFLFRPSLGVRLINIVQAGSISGLVTDASQIPLGNVTVTASRDGQEVGSSSTDADGTYTLIGLTTGDYTVTFSAEGYTDIQVADVAVTPGQVTDGVNAALQVAAPTSQPGA